MKKSFHNTTNETGQKLQSYEAKAYTQDQQIADFFTCHPGELYTPWEIQSLVFKHPKPPITSVRRAMSNLTRDGILTKTKEKKEVGIYNRASYSWTINQKYYETLMAMEVVFSQTPKHDAADAAAYALQGLPLVGGGESGEEIIKPPEKPTEGLKMGDILEPIIEIAKEEKSKNEAKNEPGHLHDQLTLDLFTPKGRALR